MNLLITGQIRSADLSTSAPSGEGGGRQQTPSFSFTVTTAAADNLLGLSTVRFSLVASFNDLIPTSEPKGSVTSFYGTD